MPWSTRELAERAGTTVNTIRHYHRLGAWFGSDAWQTSGCRFRRSVMSAPAPTSHRRRCATSMPSFRRASSDWRRREPALQSSCDRLSPDADEHTRRQLADRLAKSLARNLTDYPWLNDPALHLSKSPYVTSQTRVEALRELYNPAQLEVLGRAHTIASDHVRTVQEIRRAGGC